MSEFLDAARELMRAATRAHQLADQADYLLRTGPPSAEDVERLRALRDEAKTIVGLAVSCALAASSEARQVEARLAERLMLAGRAVEE